MRSSQKFKSFEEIHVENVNLIEFSRFRETLLFSGSEDNLVNVSDINEAEDDCLQSSKGRHGLI